jgi:EAL domain-containing protein (putative c-di-GMP-specific phosphodiesterase class I)
MSHKKHSLLTCECKTDARTLVLLADDFASDFPEFASFDASDGWRFLDDFGVVELDVGSGKRWASAADVIDFFRTVLGDEARLGMIRAAWRDRAKPLGQQLVKMGTEAETLAELTDNDASELLDILQNRRLESWFQAVIDARTGRVWGFECLMRGRRSDGELVGALELLKWANHENLLFMLDRVSRETHLENAGRLGFGSECRFLINFLPTAIYKPEFCLQTSLAAMRRSGLVPSQVIFEVVETEKVLDTAHLVRILDFYRTSGFGVALDDMGSGYAGLTLLGDLKPDLIKIDRHLVSNSVNSQAHFNICSALISMAKANGQLILAEGVETEEEVRLMTELGVDLFQGYYFKRPDPNPVFWPEESNELASANCDLVPASIPAGTIQLGDPTQIAKF